MSDICDDCGVKCKDMLIASALNAIKLNVPNPCHCLLIAIIEAANIIYDKSAPAAATAFMVSTMSILNRGFNLILADDDNHGEVRH